MLYPPGRSVTFFRVLVITAWRVRYDLFLKFCMCDGFLCTFLEGESCHFPALAVIQRLHYMSSSLHKVCTRYD